MQVFVGLEFEREWNSLGCLYRGTGLPRPGESCSSCCYMLPEVVSEASRQISSCNGPAGSVRQACGGIPKVVSARYIYFKISTYIIQYIYVLGVVRIYRLFVAALILFYR